jgi:hypothetical protein
MPYVNTASTITLQHIINIARAMGDIEPVLNVAGSSTQLPMMIADDVMSAICAPPIPWKWNEFPMPQFVTNIDQQDYAGIYPNGMSLTQLAWLQRGIAVDINSSIVPKPSRYIEVGRQVGAATGGARMGTSDIMRNPLFEVSFFPNRMLYYGVWGDSNEGNATWGNNPGPGLIYTSPYGNGTSMPSNPVTQIVDQNNNLLVLTTYGTCGSTAPYAPAASLPGTSGGITDHSNPLYCSTLVDGTAAWTVVDPLGQGFRLMPPVAESGTVWQFNMVGQMLPVRFVKLSQTLAPLPDEYECLFRQGFVTQCYRYSPHAKISAKFDKEWKLWLQAVEEARTKFDREKEENVFTPARGIMGGSIGKTKWVGPANPFGYPMR